jgi:hypothetical protein
MDGCAPHQPNLSGVRKSVVAIAGTATRLPQRSEITRSTRRPRNREAFIVKTTACVVKQRPRARIEPPASRRQHRLVVAVVALAHEQARHVFDGQSLERVVKTDPAMVRSLLTMTTDNLQHVENHMLLLGRKNSREKVAAFLLEMHGRLAAADVMALPMSRRDIADYLGLSLETVSRELSELHRKGYLRFLNGMQRQIVILNAAGLAELDR